MSIGKDIFDCTETSALVTGDGLLLQRGDKFFHIKSENLGGGLFKSTTELSQGDVDTIFSNPPELILAQGANTYIDIVSAVAFRNGTAYTATDPTLKLVFTGQTQAYHSTRNTFLTAVTASLAEKLFIVSAGNVMFANTGISAYLTADPTSTGPLTIEIVYRVSTFV